jgi:hypothetical protein
MADSNPGPTTADTAERAVAYLEEISPEMRGCALLGPGGEVLAVSGGDREAWGEAARGLLAAADAAGGERASHVHVATGEGEVFCVREGELALVAVTQRFVLASLMVFDMRVALRDLAPAGAAT